MHIIKTALIGLVVVGAIPMGYSIAQEGNIVITSSSVKSGKDSIDGQWNYQQAQEIILPYLQKYKWERSEQVHKFLGQYKLPYNNKQGLLVATSSMQNGHECHLCSPNVSFFEFEKRTTGWKLTNSYLAVSTLGSWGKTDPSDINVKTIGNNGDNIYGIMLTNTTTGSGNITSELWILAKVNGSMRKVLDTTISHDNSGMGSESKSNWNSKITIQPGTKGFFNILVASKGIRDNKPFAERELFKFNGQKYVSQKSERSK
jgi:hypothetical protein